MLTADQIWDTQELDTALDEARKKYPDYNEGQEGTDSAVDFVMDYLEDAGIIMDEETYDEIYGRTYNAFT